MKQAYHHLCLWHLVRASCDLQTLAILKPNALCGIFEALSTESHSKYATSILLEFLAC